MPGISHQLVLCGKLFCHIVSQVYKHYWAKFGEFCRGCCLLMTWLAIVAGEFKYHSECFAYMSCKVIIEDGDVYVLV